MGVRGWFTINGLPNYSRGSEFTSSNACGGTDCQHAFYHTHTSYLESTSIYVVNVFSCLVADAL